MNQKFADTKEGNNRPTVSVFQNSAKSHGYPIELGFVSISPQKSTDLLNRYTYTFVL